MLTAKSKKELLNFITSRILNPNFIQEFRRLVSEGKLVLYKRDQRLMEYIAEYTGVPVDELRHVWGDVYKILFDAYYNKLKTTKSEPVSAFFITPASIIYYALYEVEGENAPEIMYYLLEPLLVPVLAGEASPNKVRKLFIPLNGGDLEATMALVADIVRRGSEYLCRPEVVNVLQLLCTTTEHLPSSKRSVMPGVPECQRLFTKYILEGACNGVY